MEVIKTFLIALILLAPTALSAAPNLICSRLLTQERLAMIAAEVESAIAAKARLEPSARLEALMREFARPILESSKRALLAHIDELCRNWSAAAKETIRDRFETMRKHNQQASAMATKRRQEGRELQPGDPTPILIATDSDGLPDLPLVKAHRELALAVLKDSKIALGPVQLEQNLAQAIIEGIRGFPGLKQKYSAEIRAISDPTLENADRILLASGGKRSPDWSEIVRESSPRLSDLAAELAASFPLGDGKSRAREAALAAASRSFSLPVIEYEGGVEPTGILLPELKIRVYLEPALGTLVVEPLKGLISNPRGPILVADHGDGTVKSNAASWKHLVAKFQDAGMNPVAIDLPNAGSGVELSGLIPTTVYLERRFQWLRARDPIGEPGPDRESPRPIVLLGRSMGSTKGYAHALLYEGPGNVVDAYVLSSFSNPETVPLQVENVYRQVAHGLLGGVMPASLEGARKFGAELSDALRDLKKTDPEALRLFGDKLLFLQGDADEDGGPTVTSDLMKFRSEYAPLSHVYVFENPLAKYVIPEIEKIDPEKWEGTHFLFSNLPNMTLEQARQLHPGISEQDVPALQEQWFEVIAVMRGFFDYLADSPSTRPEMTRSREVFRAFRRKVCGLDANGRERTFLQEMADRFGLRQAVLEAARPGRGVAEGAAAIGPNWSRYTRFRKVMDYWMNERGRALSP